MINSEISHSINMYQDYVSKQELLVQIKIIVKETSIAHILQKGKKRDFVKYLNLNER